LLWRLADLIERDLEELAELESIDNGKPYAVARVADLPLSVDIFRYMAGWATKITGSTMSLSLPGETLYRRRMEDRRRRARPQPAR
jgi:phenylacetaldehyde dehydrogenase